MQTSTLIIVWAALCAVAFLLALVRKIVARHEDDTLHLHEFDSELVQHQRSLAGFLNHIDRFGKFLTIIVLLSGIALIIRIFYLGWINSLQMK